MCIMQRYTYFSDYGTGSVRILGPRQFDVADYGVGSVWLPGPGCPMLLITEQGRILSHPTDGI